MKTIGNIIFRLIVAPFLFITWVFLLVILIGAFVLYGMDRAGLLLEQMDVGIDKLMEL